MLRRLDLEAAYLAYGLAAVWLAASSFLVWLAISGFGLDREAQTLSISTIEHAIMIGICLAPTLVSCGLAAIAMRDRRPWQANVFGFAALLVIVVCFGIAVLWANRVAGSEI